MQDCRCVFCLFSLFFNCINCSFARHQTTTITNNMSLAAQKSDGRENTIIFSYFRLRKDFASHVTSIRVDEHCGEANCLCILCSSIDHDVFGIRLRISMVHCHSLQFSFIEAKKNPPLSAEMEWLSERVEIFRLNLESSQGGCRASKQLLLDLMLEHANTCGYSHVLYQAFICSRLSVTKIVYEQE